MQPEVFSGLIGFGGAIVGGAASFGGVWLTLSHQRKQARETRLLEIGQAAADKALTELIALGEFLGSLRDNEVVAETDERLPYLATAVRHLKNVELAVTRLPDQDVRDRVNGALNLTRRYRAAGPRHFFVVRWLRELTQDMIEVLSAYVRHDTLPPRSEDVLRKQDIVARYEERQRRHLEHLYDPANVDPREGDDTSPPSAN
ncbi:hypothetical protein ACFYVV_37855 [Streptomyces tendae]|uniref:hypothetical protein n=1 Tax=Streptomyces tendae TaxID=1932 RepID=UPI00367E2DE1